MGRRYTSFDHGDWHFATLHNIRLLALDSYVREFDDEQMRLLKNHLSQNKNKPTILFGHFLPVSTIKFFDGRAEFEDNDWTLSAQRLSRNPMALVEAVKGENRKSFFSGHIHRRDRVEAMETPLATPGRSAATCGACMIRTHQKDSGFLTASPMVLLITRITITVETSDEHI